jgi:hypothetical protein
MLQKSQAGSLIGEDFLGAGGSPEPSTESGGGKTTSRKCANCGQTGHIKTNKKLCPLLNGTIQRDPNAEESAGLGSLSAAPMAAGFLGGS